MSSAGRAAKLVRSAQRASSPGKQVLQPIGRRLLLLVLLVLRVLRVLLLVWCRAWESCVLMEMLLLPSTATAAIFQLLYRATRCRARAAPGGAPGQAGIDAGDGGCQGGHSSIGNSPGRGLRRVDEAAKEAGIVAVAAGVRLPPRPAGRRAGAA